MCLGCRIAADDNFDLATAKTLDYLAKEYVPPDNASESASLLPGESEIDPQRVIELEEHRNDLS
jgi:hypothetical protein